MMFVNAFCYIFSLIKNILFSGFMKENPHMRLFCLEYIDNFSFKSAAWEPFRDFIPEDERNCFVDAYNKRLTSSDPVVQVAPHISFWK
jgi:hypothetical protein